MPQITAFYSFSFALALTFSLISCTANTPETASFPPKEVVSAQTPNPNVKSDKNASLAHQVNLFLNFKGNSLLQDFALQQTQDICLPELKSIETVLTLPENLSEESAFQLKAQGMRVEGPVVKINTKVNIIAELSSIEALIKGLEVIVPNLPQGKIKAVSHLNNAQGNSMGSLNYEFDLLEKDEHVYVSFQTTQAERTPNGCTSLTVNLTGARLISTSGGLLEAVEKLPVKENAPPQTSVPGSKPALPARMHLDFPSKYLTALGETQQLNLVLFDASGQKISLDAYELEWFSSRPQDISVDEKGLVTARVGLGYAEIGVRILGFDLEEKALFDISDPSFFSKSSKKRGSGTSSSSNQPGSDTSSAPDYGFLSRNFNLWTGSNTNKAVYKVSQLGEVSLIADTSTTLPDFSEGQAGGILSTGDKIYAFFKVNGDTEWHLYTIDFFTGEATLLKAFDNPAVNPGGGAPYQGDVYFIASTNAEGNELWKTDGTPEGTVLVKDIDTSGDGLAINGSSGMVIYNDFLYFAANNGSDGVELWKTDGSTNGTVQVANINAAAASSEPRELQVVGDYLYLFANNGSNNGVMYELDHTDTLRTVINESNVSIQGSELLGQKFYFHTGSTHNSAQIHVWDQAGKTLNSITAVDPATHQCVFLGNLSGKIYFLAQNTQTNNVDLYSTQGSNETTQIESNVITDHSATDLQGGAQQLNNKIYVSFKVNNNADSQMYLLDASGFRDVSNHFTDQISGGSGSYEYAFFGDNKADISSYNADRIYMTLMDAGNQKHTYFYSEGTAESTVKLGETVDFITAQNSGNYATIASVFGFTYHMYYSNMELPSYGLPINTDKVYFTLGFQ